MEVIFEIVKTIVPIILTGIITFWVTRYTQNRSVPLEKMEIAYNRVYYPMYKIVRNKKWTELCHEEIKKEMDCRLKKYDKYISQSTRSTYNDYIKALENGEDTKVYLQNFQNNILSYNNRLRYYLGYPQASYWEVYTYLDKRSKRIINLCLCIAIIYILSIIYAFFGGRYIVYLCCIFILYTCWIIFCFVIEAIITKIKRLGVISKHYLGEMKSKFKKKEKKLVIRK